MDAAGSSYLLDDIRGLTVPLADQLGWLSSVPRLQLTSRHGDGVDAQLLVCQVALEGLALALASPDTCQNPSICR